MRRLTLGLIMLLLALLVGLPATAQSDVAMGQPTAEGDFGEPIRFSTTFVAPEAPDRVELLLHLPGEDSDRVDIAPVDELGDDRYRATVFQGGHVVPNTQYEFRFRVLTEDGAVIGPEASYRVRDRRLDWQVLEGDRVNVWWHEGSRDFAQRAQAIGEAAIDEAAVLLGVTDIEPVDFIIYSDPRSFREAMGPATRENVGGQAHPSIRTLFGLIEPRQIDSDWVEELVVHELTHLVFDEAVANPYQYPPRWLNEGLAVYLSKGYDSGDRDQVEGAAGSDTIIPLGGSGRAVPDATRTDRTGLR